MSIALVTLPQSVFTAGNYGPYVSAPLPAGSTGYKVLFTKTGWPVAPAQDVCSFLIELSQDGGTTWQPEAYRMENNGNGQLATAVKWAVGFGISGTDDSGNGIPLSAPDSVSWKLRLSLQTFIACSVVVAMSSLP